MKLLYSKKQTYTFYQQGYFFCSHHNQATTMSFAEIPQHSSSHFPSRPQHPPRAPPAAGRVQGRHPDRLPRIGDKVTKNVKASCEFPSKIHLKKIAPSGSARFSAATGRRTALGSTRRAASPWGRGTSPGTRPPARTTPTSPSSPHRRRRRRQQRRRRPPQVGERENVCICCESGIV